MKRRIRQFLGAIVAGCYSLSFFLIAHANLQSNDDLEEIVSKFSFTAMEIKPKDETDFKLTPLRKVHPEYSNIAGWISSVGASVALGDVDGDGLPNDYCLVDSRNDSVTIAPVPGASRRNQKPHYDAIVLRTPTEGYDPKTIAPMGCVLADVDADGATDAIVYYWGRTPVVFRHQGLMGSDTFTPVEIVPGREVWFTNAAVFADIDGDGYDDLIFGNYFPDGSGVLDESGSRPVEMQHSMSRAENAGRNRLFLNVGARSTSIKFDDKSEQLNGAIPHEGWTLAVGTADLNGDGLPEIYFANDFGPDRLLKNLSSVGAPYFELVEGKRGFTDLRSGVLGRDSFKGMGVDFGDVDGDGLFDIYVSNIAQDHALYESHFLFIQNKSGWTKSHAPFVNESGQFGLARSSWSWDCKLADFANDGHLEALQATGFVKGKTDRWPELQELAMGNDELLKYPASWPRFTNGDDLSGNRHMAFFATNRQGIYEDISSLIGLGTPAVSRGISVADVDGDGLLDFAIAGQWEASTFYRNTTASQNGFLNLDVRFVNPNGTTRPAVGAAVRVMLPSGRVLIGFSDLSNGHSGHRSPEIHFGLGKIEKDQSFDVEIVWREDGQRKSQKYKLPPGKHEIVLDQPQKTALVINMGAKL